MLQASKLSLRVAQRVLVDDLDWQIDPGQCWCVIGRNGAGKSSLLRTLAGLRKPDGGSLSMDGRELSSWPLAELARKRAWLPQERNDVFGYRVIDMVLAARYPYQDSRYWESGTDLALARAALQQLDVGHLSSRDVRTLSGGERQRVAIAAILAQDTPLLLLDEPTSALDLAHQVAVMEILADLCRNRGKSVVLVSHDINLVQRAATHALLLTGTGSWQAGPVADVMTASSLSTCLGYPIDVVLHGDRMVFVPSDVECRNSFTCPEQKNGGAKVQ